MATKPRPTVTHLVRSISRAMSSPDEDESQKPRFVDPKEFKETMTSIGKRMGAVADFLSQAKKQPPIPIVEPKFNCQHYNDEDISSLESTWMEIWYSKGAASCEHCLKKAPETRQKGKKNKDPKGQGKDQSLWGCLHCGKVLCGGRDKVPQDQARSHHQANNKHLWAASYEDPTIIYCFKCNKEVALSFLDLDKLKKKPQGVKKVKKQSEDVLSPPLHEAMPPSPLQDLGPSDSELTPTTTVTDTNAESHQMSGPAEQLKVSPPAVTSKSSADQVGPIIVKGMENLGNTCLFNAVIQGLLALSSMRATILRSDVHTGRLALLLKELFLLTEASSGTENQLDIGKLLRAFSSNSQFERGKVHCSHDCFVSFRRALHLEEVEEWKEVKDGIEDHITIASFIFAGTRFATITGVCSHSSSSESTPFYELLLPVPSKWTGCKDVVDGPVSLHDCLQAQFGQATTLPAWECTDCNSERKEKKCITREADQRSYIRIAPIVLTIDILRVIGVDKKLHGHVNFLLVLDIEEFMDPSFVCNSSTKYNLVAVIEHSGTATQGHYVSYTKSGSAWFCASDAIVEEVSDKKILACEAFLLFYERVGDTTPPPALLCKEDQWTDVVVKRKKKKLKAPQSALPTRHYKSVLQAKMPSKVKKPAKNLGKSVPPASSSFPHDGDFLGAASKRLDENTIQHFKKFLKSNYLAWKGIFNVDCTVPLNVSYYEIMKFSRHLALMMCKDYNRLIKRLEAAAIEFIKGPNGSDTKVILRILQRPKRHETWKGYRMRICLAKPMKVHGHTKSNLAKPSPRSVSGIYKPSGEAILMLKEILCHMISRHKRGYSWNGSFNTRDIDVLNERVFLISKPPRKFKISSELIKAMENDFLRYAQVFLEELINFVNNGDREVPYLRNFYEILSNMKEYAEYWEDEGTSERFTILLVNHPFLKTSIIRAYLLSGIYAGCRAHDLYDSKAEFKSVLKGHCGDTVRWISRIKNLANTICTAVFKFDPSKMKENVDKSSGQVAEEADDKDKEIYDVDLLSFVEYMRNLFHHGPDHSKEKKKLTMDGDGNVYYDDNIPREQYMHSLEESEIGASVAVDEVVWKSYFFWFKRTP